MLQENNGFANYFLGSMSAHNQAHLPSQPEIKDKMGEKYFQTTTTNEKTSA
jgi:phospholipase C